jgi:hypothetical protein
VFDYIAIENNNKLKLSAASSGALSATEEIKIKAKKMYACNQQRQKLKGKNKIMIIS